jgi:protein-S-isoprenylcysteine O-methyltransferase Ste14
VSISKANFAQLCSVSLSRQASDFLSHISSLEVGKVALVKRLTAYSIIVPAILIGGGSLVLFAAFLTLRPFTIIRLEALQAHILIWDSFLSMLFFMQHSGMIRTSFRTFFSASIPPCYQPAIYAIVSGTILTAVVLLWQTSQTVLFRLQGPVELVPRAISLLAIGGFLWSARALGAFDPFGWVSIIVHIRGKQPAPQKFVLRGPYLWVRHPLYFFSIVLIWSVPELHSDRLLFNLIWTSWIVVGSYLEERDLASQFGESYRRYQRTVPMLLPWRGPVGRRL